MAADGRLLRHSRRGGVAHDPLVAAAKRLLSFCEQAMHLERDRARLPSEPQGLPQTPAGSGVWKGIGLVSWQSGPVGR